MQPEWREVGPGGELMRRGEGDWPDELQRPGQNGMVIVLLTLWWWHEALGGDADTAGWDAAVRDVVWVLSKLVAIHAEAAKDDDAVAGGDADAAAAAAADKSRPRKKRRTV